MCLHSSQCIVFLLVGCDVPLVADIHFSPPVAMRVADAFEKVRINPGNFADGIKSFENKVYNTRVGFHCFIVAIFIINTIIIILCRADASELLGILSICKCSV